MKISFLIFLVLTLWGREIVVCDDGFIVFWAPSRISDGKLISTTIFASDLQDDFKVGIQYRSSNSKFTLKNEEFKKIDIINKEYMARSGSLLNLILHRSVIFSGSTVHQCSTKSIRILPEQRNFYIFIQTDKPIYKPGDEVRFRILVIDSDMKPFHMNSLKVDITDPFGRIIQTFRNIENQYLGLFENTFKLSSSTIFGDWDIQVVVDSKEQYKTAKVFAVQKYILPLFEVHIDTDNQHYSLDDQVQISFYAKYSFGEFVTGNAELVIKGRDNGIEYYRNLHRNVDIIEGISKRINYELNVDTPDEIALEAVVTFTELESGLSFNKSTIFYAHNKNFYKITPHHSSKFTADSNFTVTVHVTEWNGKKLKNSNEKVDLKFSFITADFDNFGKIVYMPIVDGVATYDIEVPKNAELLHLEVRFTNSKTYIEHKVYRARIERGFVESGILTLNVEHEPKSLKLNDKVKISVRSDRKLNKIVSIITNKLGHVQSEIISCNNNEDCDYFVTINKEMMPMSTVTVYHIVDKSHIYQGSTKIGSKVFERNHLTFDLSKSTAKPKQKLQMDFTTSKNSKIYLLAFDKNLKFLKDGNDITADDVSSAIGDHDGRIQMVIDDFSAWSVCTKDELDAVGVRDVIVIPGGGKVYRVPDIQNSNMHSEPEPSNAPESPQKQSILRQNFPETWIFESFETEDAGSIQKEFTVPDSITTWSISAFSLHKNNGLAMTSTQELKVMKEFFIKMDLPYSIKFLEVLRLDILVFNFIETKDFLKTEVTLENLNGKEFQFVEFSNNHGSCTPSYTNRISLTSEMSRAFPYKSVKKLSFYIRSNPADNEFSDKVPKKIKLKVTAIGYGRYSMRYEDEMQKELLVEPTGVSDFIIRNQDYKLDGVSTNPYLQHANFTEELKSVNVVVGGDYMSNSMDLSSRFEFYPSDCLEQRTSKLKGNVEYFRYRLAKELNPSTKQFSDFYQSLLEQQTKSWNYAASVGYRAYFLEAVASAMEIGALPKQNSIIEQELDYLKSRQQSNGEFDDFGDFPATKDKYGTPAASYFKTAFVLIPFLKFNGLVDKSYTDVIQKGFDFLKSNENRYQLNCEGYPVAAFAYALNNDKINANRLLNEVEKLSVDLGSNQKCYKVSRDDTECELNHTSYAVLAYIQLNEISKALPLVNWLIKSNNLNYFYSNTHDYALATEPIAKLAKYLKTDSTQLKVILKNERNFEKIVDINNENSGIFHDIQFPQYSQDVISTANGHGYCSITTIFERIISLPKVTAMFKLTVNPTERNDKEKIVKICAEYAGKSVVMNVIYEVEMQSGYVFVEVVDLKSQTDIKLVAKIHEGTKVHIYFNDFKQDQKYCVDVKARKVFDVKNAKLAGVKVYDYNDKQNVAIEFYKFTSEEC